MQPVRLLLANGIFAEAREEEEWYGSRVVALAGEAQSLLAHRFKEIDSILAASAQADLRHSLARFLARLLLLQPDDRSLRQTIDLWVEAQSEMLARLVEDQDGDREALGRAFGSKLLSGKIVGIEAGLSDRHHGGRSAAILTFASGGRVVYKPRAMKIDDWYSQLLGWFNQAAAPMALRNPLVLCREGYGWMGFVAHQRCQSPHELREYYRNAGALLCVLHVIGATDAHFQNVIASGVSPVLIDAETLFQPTLSAAEADANVTQTGLIPNFRFGPQGQTYDVSGLGCLHPLSTHFEIPEWSAAGVEFRPARLMPGKNIPFADGRPPLPHTYIVEMVQGFSATYRVVIRHRESLARRVAEAAGLQIRYLVRETTDYYAAWQDLDAASDGIFLPDLRLPLGSHTSIRSIEVAALREFDIPCFTTTVDGRDLAGIPSCFAQSGLERALVGLEEMSEAKLARQLQHLRLAWSFSELAGAFASKA